MALYNTEEANQECLTLLDKARNLSNASPGLDLCKQRILLLMRMQKDQEALQCLHEYTTLLTSYKEQHPTNREEQIWSDREMEWAQQLTEKINKM